MSIQTANLGFPRIGRQRELKFALEDFWSGKSDEATLQAKARALRAAHWQHQREAGISIIPSNDFSLYDHVLDLAVMTGAIPDGYGWTGGPVSIATLFALARGSASTACNTCACNGQHSGDAEAKPALEMTKWFDTNYHYLVPELHAGQTFSLTGNKPLEHFREAAALGIHTRPVILGPVTFLTLAKTRDGSASLALLEKLLPVYGQILKELKAAGADWVQMDEPCLVTSLSTIEKEALVQAYRYFAAEVPGLSLMLATYFGGLEDNLETALSLPVAGLHVDLVRAPQPLAPLLANAPEHLRLSLGIIDGRNVWRADLARCLDRISAAATWPGSIEIAPSCSLLHVPVDLALETDLDQELASWLAFATQKLGELAALRNAFAARASGSSQLDGDTQAAFDTAAAALATRSRSHRVSDPAVQARVQALGTGQHLRGAPFALRQVLQRTRNPLPLFPTTTIGSFPQTADVRKARALHGHGKLADEDYTAFLKRETAAAIRWQDEIGLDVLVHGEFERNDMVQYFGEQLKGFAFTRNAWVQSYGSRCVRPPIIYGDVSRPAPMTVDWWRFAQSQTGKPVKGMLTGPVTILNWSFVRDDLPRETVCRQIALAIRDEVSDLETAGASMIQIDEAALREGLPLRRRDWDHYLDWAIRCFRICCSETGDSTQIHTHMCYSEFNGILPAIIAMDADVISIEASRSRMELLDALTSQGYPNEIGPGIYDIHSPRIPGIGEIETLLTLARQRLRDGQLWVNPDCGLKTRKWDEVRPALINMVEAAHALRRAANARTQGGDAA